MIPACLLHDIGKPMVAFQDEKDVLCGTYSFTYHEEASYQVIKDCPLISPYTKMLVRNHYLLRGMQKAKEKGLYGRYKRMRRIYDRLTPKEVKDLEIFQGIDDLGK